MKYFIKALIKTRMIWVMLLEMVVGTVAAIINAKILQLIALATNHPNDMRYINLMIIGCLINTLLGIIGSRCNGSYRHITYTEMISNLTKKLLNADYSLYIKYSPGVISTVRDAPYQLTALIRVITKGYEAVIKLITDLVMIIAVGKILTIPLVVVYTIGGITLLKVFKKWGELDKEFDDLKHVRNDELDKIVNGYAEVRSFCTEAIHEESIIKKNYRLSNLLLKRNIYDLIINGGIDIIDTVTSLAVLMYSIMLLRNGQLSSATAVTLVMYAWRMTEPFMVLVGCMDEFSSCFASSKKYTELMDYENTVSDGCLELDEFQKDITFENVSFSYDKTSTVLDGVSLNIKKGAHIGICGASGGGKSTMLKLIPKFYDVTKGSIKIDGVDIREISTRSLRKHIGIVHQDPYIFDASIEENVQYGNPAAQHAEIVEACKKAAIYDVIMQMPDRFDTVVGPKGLKLSGGQKQRIALARIFLSDTDIILLDEATSGLDNDTETIVQDSLNMFKDKTMIVIAHRLSTIKESDKIVVIDGHKIVEEGTHEELLDLNGIYKSLQK